ncbi:uncharacterized protein N7487_007296 [Penicillium crustosum]|uniref:uncharacterized protein n=1 Tax=Penicillium crustosum TaxID=36656 RepID=UPI002397F15F|nr:uncharacterized protein N7487_007296 [Penicillium crustosum]KAJ5401400.1 hypothetical protein N7487_007296 [Penicillium crustosum]
MVSVVIWSCGVLERNSNTFLSGFLDTTSMIDVVAGTVSRIKPQPGIDGQEVAGRAVADADADHVAAKGSEPKLAGPEDTTVSRRWACC